MKQMEQMEQMGQGQGEGDRYAMHALQAAYVRSVARTRLDLMKTLDARREAALVVPGPDGVPAAQAAAIAAGRAMPGRRRSSGSRGSSRDTSGEGSVVVVGPSLVLVRGCRVYVCSCLLFFLCQVFYQSQSAVCVRPK